MELKLGNVAAMDAEGNVVMPRTKASHPYSYDPIIIYSAQKKREGHPDSTWSDRLQQRYGDALTPLKQKHFGSTGDYWPEQDPKKVQGFLAELLDEPDLHLIRITEHCNVATGYPTWHFMFEDSSHANL